MIGQVKLAAVCVAVTIAVVVVVVLVFPTSGWAAAPYRSDRVDALAERLTGRVGTTVVGQLPAECAGDYGCADIDGNRIYMRGDLLVTLDRTATMQPYLAALAVFVFCHEARHVRGTYNERVADAWAISHVYRVARLLGADDQRAWWILRWARFWDLRIGA